MWNYWFSTGHGLQTIYISDRLISYLKGTVSVFSSDTQCTDDNARFTQLAL